MTWLRQNAPWLAVVAAILGGALSVHVKATLADTDREIAVLKARNDAQDERDQQHERRMERIEDKLDRILEAVRGKP